MKSNQLTTMIVNRYIGVEGGYLGDFTYRTHKDFYPEYCGLEKDPEAFEGTTRERFILIFKSSTPKEQSKIIRGLLERFQVGEGPKTRTDALRKTLETEAKQLEQLGLLNDPILATSGEMLFEVLEDAKSLIEHRNVASAVDRVHTAFQGYLRSLCEIENIPFTKDDDLVKLIKSLFAHHPKLQVSLKSSEVQNIVRNLVSISDSLNPIRNQGSRAHPNKIVVQEPEATLAVNAIYSVLTYLEQKISL
jgi:hypothetical protein